MFYPLGRLTHKESKSEIIYIAEADSSSKLYKFDLDLGAQMDEFKSKSGDYVLALLLGESIFGVNVKNKVRLSREEGGFDLDLGAQMDELKSKSGNFALALLLGELILGFRCKNCFGSGSLFMSGSDFFSLNPDPQKRLKIVSTSVKIFF